MASIAHAQGIDFEVERAPQAAQGPPALTLIAAREARNIQLRLRRTGCGEPRDVQAHLDQLEAGGRHRFALSQPEGHCVYSGELSAIVAGVEARRAIDFETDLTGPPKLTALPYPFEAETHTVRVTFNRVADRGTVEAFDAHGALLASTVDQDLGDARPGEPLSLDAGPGAAARLRVTVYDRDGVAASLDVPSAPAAQPRPR